MIVIEQATEKHISVLAPLFNAYRLFYGEPTDEVAAKTFLKDRFIKKENIVFLAYAEGKAVGFTQLYTTFSSVSMQPFYILNDLYVDPQYRSQGIGEALLQYAQNHCVKLGYKGLQLETAIDNPAQKLYEKLHWKNDPNFVHYFWTAPKH